jgi:arylamine N-acetyltransferase
LTEFTINRRFHDAPWLTISDPEVLTRFLTRFGIAPTLDRDILISRITNAFREVPYENLTKILKADAVISATSAMRYPDELIGDFLRWGTGGTCFSLTAAIVAVFDAVGIEVYPILADRHYGADTHCGLILVQPDGRILLLDPGYLLFAPLAVPYDQTVSIETGHNRIELVPLCGGTKIELYTIVKNNRKYRLVFKVCPVSDDAFGRAWERSFAFEMMTYPIITRQANGCHQYLQGNVLAERDANRTRRTILTPDKQIEFITRSLGIHHDIVTRALEVVSYGRNSAAAAG